MRFNINLANRNILEPIRALWMEPIHALRRNRLDRYDGTDSSATVEPILRYYQLVAFEKWLVREWEHVLPKSPIGRAIHYTYNIFHKLTRYHLDGRYRIDNNLAENSIRPIACGRKNYLFCGNDDAAEDAAVIYSLMGCCKAADVDFRKWLNHVLGHIHEYDTDLSLNLADFLPDNLKEAGVL